MAEAAAGDRASASELERPRLAARTAFATLGAALFASVVIPGSRVGLGLALASQAVLAAAALGAARRSGPRRVGLLTGAALLTLTPLLRDASWLVTIDLLLALVLAVMALGGADSLAGHARAGLTFIPNLVIGPLAAVGSAFARAPEIGSGAPASLARAGLITAGLLTVFIALFVSADPAFAQLYDDLTPSLGELDLPARIGVALIALAVGGALALAVAWRDEGPPFAEPTRRLGPLEWGAALVALVVVFAGFVAVQFVVLFGGRDHVLETAGLTYAEYARQGFAQLVLAAVLVLAVIAAAVRLSRTETKGQRLALHSLLAALAILTLVILASAAHRLDLYVDAFGATRARLQAISGCTVIAGVLIVSVVALFTPDRRWLTHAIAGVVALVALGLTAINPDGLIAQRNVDRYQHSGRFDVGYNAGLSADATPALTELPAPLAAQTMERQKLRLALPDGFWGTNVGRNRARDALVSRHQLVESP
jgi:Domain of unknown function (DUF4173)